jgi:hypothetical protein
MKKLSRIISSNAIVWPSGERQKRGSDEPPGSRSLRQPCRGFTPSLGAGFGDRLARSRPVRDIVRSGCPERSPSFRWVPPSGSLPTPRNRTFSTPHSCPVVKGESRTFSASVAVVRSPVRGARCAEETVVPDRSLVHRAPSSATRSIGRDGRLLPGACGHEPPRKVRIYASTA